MVVEKRNVMYQCKVFYIGCDPPSKELRGVEAIQIPLKNRYKGDVSSVEGYDVTVTVTPNELHVDYSNGEVADFSLPIQTLSICAAVRCVDDASDSSNMKFIPVNSVITATEPDSDHPAIFSTVMRRDLDDELQCHAFICNSTRDALHLVNATQTAHTAYSRGFNETGAMKFFIDRSTEFDRTLRLSQANAEKRVDTRKIYMYREDYDTRQYDAESKTYVTSVDNTNTGRINRASKIYDNNVTMEGNTYYVKAGDIQFPSQPPAQHSETVVIKSSMEDYRPPTPPQQQVVYVDKPVIKPAPRVEYPPPKIIERPVVVEGPPPPKMEPQRIVVDKPIFKEMVWPDPPQPEIIENTVYIDPPPAPRQQAQKIYVDRPVVKDWPTPPDPPPPIIETVDVVIEPPAWPEQKPQKILIDKPILKEMKPPPPQPPPIIEEVPVEIELPEYPIQKPYRIVVEKPCFNAPKPAPKPPTPIIERKEIFIDPPPYPKQEAQRIVVETPVIGEPGPPPAPPKPIIIQKPVHIAPPKYQVQEPQRIVVETPVMRDPGPPPPLPKPIIIHKKVYIDPPPWPKVEPQVIVVEKPVFRPRPPQPIPKPVIIEKPVYIDVPEPPAPEPQRIVVEKPMFRRTTYGQSETRQLPSAYNYHYQSQPNDIRGSYVVTSGQGVQGRGLRRYAWSDSGEDRYRSGWDYNADTGGYRLFGQPRDFRERQFMNERGFSRRINEESRYAKGPGSYTYGDTLY